MKYAEILTKLIVMSGLIYAIYWVVAIINTWTQCLVSITSSLKIIAEKLS